MYGSQQQMTALVNKPFYVVNSKGGLSSMTHFSAVAPAENKYIDSSSATNRALLQSRMAFNSHRGSFTRPATRQDYNLLGAISSTKNLLNGANVYSTNTLIGGGDTKNNNGLSQNHHITTTVGASSWGPFGQRHHSASQNSKPNGAGGGVKSHRGSTLNQEMDKMFKHNLLKDAEELWKNKQEIK
jgi:hypothetical protein